MKLIKVIVVVALVLMVAGLVLGTGCGTQGKQGVSITGASVNSAGHLILTLSNKQQLDAGSVVGSKGDKGDPGGLAWGTPVPSGTITLSVSGDGWSKRTVTLNTGDRVVFSFTIGVLDGYVYYWAHDPDYNIILTGNGGNSAALGHGAFIAAESGQYDIYFQASGILGATVTLNYTVYPVYVP
jgi:hypothetical protein